MGNYPERYCDEQTGKKKIKCPVCHKEMRFDSMGASDKKEWFLTCANHFCKALSVDQFIKYGTKAEAVKAWGVYIDNRHAIDTDKTVCPVCHKPMTLNCVRFTSKKGWFLTCKNLNCLAGSVVQDKCYKTKAEAIEAWNKGE